MSVHSTLGSESIEKVRTSRQTLIYRFLRTPTSALRTILIFIFLLTPSSVLRTIVISILLLTPTSELRTQDLFPHTELAWRTIPTRHTFVHYHQGTERFAQRTAEIVDTLYYYLSTLYAYTPDSRLSIILRDHDDYSNGAAYFYDNKIEIWVPSLDFELRGTHPWLENVLTHELTHIFQMQTSMKWTRRIPAFYLQWLGYEAERRPDVLYGYPNVLVSYPVSGFVVPAWFAEGTAQYNHPALQYDYWDSHRDMILRMHLLEGKPLSWEEMAVFGKTSLGNESSYNAGFSFVEYLAQTYGEDKVTQISKALGSLHRATIGGAIEAVVGREGEEVYDEWLSAKREAYRSVEEEIRNTRTEGELIEPEGFGNFHPSFSRDGKKIYYVSNRGEDYFGLSRLVEYDLETKTSRVLASRVQSTISPSPDGRYLYYTRLTRSNPNWSMLSDIFRYDLQEQKETRLTKGWRAFSPSVSPDGTRLLFAVGEGGTMNVGRAELRIGDVGLPIDGVLTEYRRLTRFEDGEQVFTPAWSADGATIAFGFSRGHNQSILVIDSSGANVRRLDPVDGDFKSLDATYANPQSAIHNPQSSSDFRNPEFSPDGNWLYFSWDNGGRFNIYRKSLHQPTVEQVTQVLGGAFQPAVDSAGNVAFARYDATGYKIAVLQRAEVKPPKIMFGEARMSKFESRNKLEYGENSKIGSFGRDVHQSPIPDPRSAIDVHLYQSPIRNPQSTILNPESVIGSDSVSASRPYRSVFSSMSLFPLLRVDNYNPSNKGIDIIKPGFYFASQEVLEKVGLFGGAAINRKFERDLFLIFQYRDAMPLLSWVGLEPTLSLELYNISRATTSQFSLYVDREYDIPISVTYNLLEFDATLTHPVLSEFTTMTLGFVYSRYNADLGSFIIPTVGLSPSFRNIYLIGTGTWLELRHRDIHPTVDMAINPVGRTVRMRATYESNKYNRDLEYDVVDGLLVPLYRNYDFVRLEMNWNEHLRMPFKRHTLSVGLRVGAITGGTADTIFHFYAGGMPGLRGYPFYSIEGTSIAMAQLTYRFPIVQELDFRLLHMYFTKLYASAFAETGDAWTGGLQRASLKKDVGVELRLEAFSWYAYPTRFSFAAAYGLNEFHRRVQNVDIRYGKEWRFYFNILFDFDILETSTASRQGRMR